MKNKSKNNGKQTTRIIALILCVVTVFGLIAGAIAGANSNSTQASILDVLSPKPRVTDEQLQKAVENNKNNDYTLASVLSALGNPGAIMTDYDGVSYNYAEEKDIEQILETYADAENYSKDSIIQLMWLNEADELVFTYIAADYETPTIIGMAKQSLEEETVGAKHIPTTEYHLTDFNEYTQDTLAQIGDMHLSSIQYPLLDCNFTETQIASSDLSAVWTTKLVQNDMGLIYILLKNDEPYQIYQDYDEKDIETYDKSENLWTGLSERQFLNEYPNATRIQLFNHEENDNKYLIISYVVKERNKDSKIEEVVYNIVDGDLYVYDEKGELVQNDQGLIIEQTGVTTKSEDDHDHEEETAEPTENTEPTETVAEPTETVEETENTETAE